MTVCKNACRECPFRRDSAPGYLGEASHDPEGFLAPHWHAEQRLPCHMQVDWTDPLFSIDEAPRCRGLLVMMRNAAKQPQDPEVLKAVNAIEKDHGTYFSYPHEFHQHHKGRDDAC